MSLQSMVRVGALGLRAGYASSDHLSMPRQQQAEVSEQKETALIDPSASIMSDDPMQAVGNLQGHAS